jgi:hypothetical protein
VWDRHQRREKYMNKQFATLNYEINMSLRVQYNAQAKLLNSPEVV